MTDTEYLLTCLAEECAEVIKECTKAQRFGLGGISPKNDAMNRVLLSEELTDVFAIAMMLEVRGNIPAYLDGEKIKQKQSKVMMYVRKNRRQQ